MLKSILLSVESNAASQAAWQLARDWAQAGNALVVGLGVVDEDAVCPHEAVPVGGASYLQARNEELLRQERIRVEQLLSEFAIQCAEANVACKVLEDEGSAVEQIVRAAQRYDLLLLGRTAGEHRWSRRDGVLWQVARSCPRPVVVAPETRSRCAEVLVAYDGSHQAARALQMAVSLGLPGVERYHVVCVADSAEQAAKTGDLAADYLHTRGLSCQLHAVADSGPAAKVILDQARRLNAGLIVLGAFGRSGLRELLFGSVARQVLEDAPVPIFLYH